jgi:septum formation protein
MLVLASQSPRRAELLRNARIAFEIDAADIDEQQREGESPTEMVARLAREKARVVAGRRASDLVLGADTTVVIENQILAKPRDKDDAAAMLRRLSGRTHCVVTGVCLIGNGGEIARSESTLVHMVEISEAEVREYVGTGEPMDKAGGYAIQGMASRWVNRIEGCYFNVVGLPVPLVYTMLRDADFGDKQAHQGGTRLR